MIIVVPITSPLSYGGPFEHSLLNVHLSATGPWSSKVGALLPWSSVREWAVCRVCPYGPSAEVERTIQDHRKVVRLPYDVPSVGVINTLTVVINDQQRQQGTTRDHKRYFLQGWSVLVHIRFSANTKKTIRCSNFINLLFFPKTGDGLFLCRSWPRGCPHRRPLPRGFGLTTPWRTQGHGTKYTCIHLPKHEGPV